MSLNTYLLIAAVAAIFYIGVAEFIRARYFGHPTDEEKTDD
jgi:predicted GIY-YIG superfamily endonuclease